ncbi:MAG: hypothetical protein ACREID_00190, partial [Planctomycetota bacterium]
ARASHGAATAIATERGAWELRIAAGRVHFTSIPEKPPRAVEMPDWTLTQLLAGYRGADELGVDLTDEDRALLTLLFPKTWPYSLPDPDHWEERKSRQELSPKAAAAVAATRLPWRLD